MPPRPFPFRLKVGIDVCHIPRIRDIITKRPDAGGGEARPLGQFLSKVLTAPERQYFWHRFQDEDAAYKSIDKVSTFLAGRWAAKEACRKACTHLGISNGMHNIMILPIEPSNNAPNAESMPPKGLILRDTLNRQTKASESKGTLIRKLGVGTSSFNINSIDGQFCEVSISHDDRFATAVAMVPSLPASWHDRTVAENKETISSIDNGNIGDSVGTDLLDILEQEKETNARLESLMPKGLEVPDVKKIQEHITLLRRRNNQLETFARAARLEQEISQSEERLEKVGFKVRGVRS